MKILSHCHMFPPHHNAGSETTLLAIMRGLLRRGHEVRVIAAESPTAEYRIDNILVEHPPMDFPNKDPWYLARYAWADVVITHLNCTGIAMHCVKETSKPLVHLVHNHKQLEFHNVIPLRTQLLIYNTEHLAAAIGRQPSIVVHPVIEPEYYKVKRNLKTADAVTFVNLTITKGALTFYELARRFLDTKFIGVRGAYGDQHEPPENLMNLEILEQMPDLRPVWKRTRVVLMPSDYESFGRVAVEAACSGIPSIVNPTDGLKEALGPAGIYIHRDKIDDYEQELHRLYDDDAYYAERSQMALELANSLKPQKDLDRIEKALKIVARTGLKGVAWTIEALGEEAYLKKAKDEGYFDPASEPKSFRPPLGGQANKKPFTSDRQIYLNSEGKAISREGRDKQILLMGPNTTISFDRAFELGIIDSDGVPFYERNENTGAIQVPAEFASGLSVNATQLESII